MTIKLVGVDDRSQINEICTSRTRTLCPDDRQTKIREGSNFRNPRQWSTSILDLSRTHGAFPTSSSSAMLMLARLHDLVVAGVAYDACRAAYPKKLLYLSRRADPAAER